jgi:hypothetical protein
LIRCIKNENNKEKKRTAGSAIRAKGGLDGIAAEVVTRIIFYCWRERSIKMVHRKITIVIKKLE